jgi:8-hydroxy-5-deazaflavin:NADPH oxidoreductase
VRVAVLGTGDVGRALGHAFVTLGHDVRMGARSAGNEKARDWVQQAGARASAGTFADAASFGELIVLATLGLANEEALRAAGPDNAAGKVLIDTTNPLDFSSGFPPKLVGGPGESGGERVQRAVPGARVVKAFNTVGHAHMFRPEFPGGPPDMFLCGNDGKAKHTVEGLLTEFGWGAVDLGGIEASGHLEAMCMVWVLYGGRTSTWNHAFKLLRR